jgi:hypothetical protein
VSYLKLKDYTKYELSCKRVLPAHNTYLLDGEIQILGMMRTKKKRLSDINQFFVCFLKLDEEIEFLRHEIKAFSVRRIASSKDRWGLSTQVSQMLEDFTGEYLNTYRASLVRSQKKELFNKKKGERRPPEELDVAAL